MAGRQRPSRKHAYLATTCRTQARKSFASAVWPIMFIWVRTVPRTLSQAGILEGLKKELEMD